MLRTAHRVVWDRAKFLRDTTRMPVMHSHSHAITTSPLLPAICRSAGVPAWRESYIYLCVGCVSVLCVSMCDRVCVWFVCLLARPLKPKLYAIRAVRVRARWLLKAQKGSRSRGSITVVWNGSPMLRAHMVIAIDSSPWGAAHGACAHGASEEYGS